mgnify:CR=1 FL=1
MILLKEASVNIPGLSTSLNNYTNVVHAYGVRMFRSDYFVSVNSS